MPDEPGWVARGLAKLRRPQLAVTGRQFGPGAGWLRVEGRFGRDGLRQFRRQAARVLAWGEPAVLVDLRECTDMSASAAIACLILDQECREAGGAMVLVAPDGRAPAVFEQIGADRTVRVAPTMEAGLAVLRGAAGPRSEPA